MEIETHPPIRLAAPPAPAFLASTAPACGADDEGAARIMPGGIGYLAPRGLDAGAVRRVFAVWEEARAPIFDRRDQDGGAADAVLWGHLSRRPIPMARIRRNADGGLLTLWTGRATPPQDGPLYPDNPLFVLIARRSSLPAQALAYDLRACGRAAVINEIGDQRSETLLTAWRRALSLRGRMM